MALLEDLVCSECGEAFKGVQTRNYGSLCSTCFDIKEKEKKDAWLAELRSGTSVEDRIAWLEEYIYDHRGDIEKVDMNTPIG